MSDFYNSENMVKCSACGGDNKNGNSFCMNCGERLIPLGPEILEPSAVKEPVVTESVERPDAEVVSSTPWNNEGSSQTYNAPPPYNAQPNYNSSGNVQSSDSNALSISSLVCGILSVVCCYCGFLIAIAGLITGAIALSRKNEGRGMAIAGLILSAIGLVVWGIINILVLILGAESADMWYNLYNMEQYF